MEREGKKVREKVEKEMREKIMKEQMEKERVRSGGQPMPWPPPPLQGPSGVWPQEWRQY